MNNTVCAIIITYNVDKKINEVIDAINDQVTQIVIVDNNSSENTISILKKINLKYENINLILNKDNVGIAKAINQGIKFASKKGFDWVLTLDHDTICEKNMINNMLQLFENYSDKDSVSIIAPRVFELNKQEYITSNNSEDKEFIYVRECIQSGSLIRMKSIKEIGTFNEKLFIYHVDFEFCERVGINKFRIIQCNRATIYHEEGYKIPKKILGKVIFYNNYSSIAVYYITRNTVYMSKRYNLLYSKRILKDFIHILFFDKDRKRKLLYMKKGLKDAFNNNYGKLIEE